MSVESANCVNIVGVQFRRAGRIYDFNAGEFELRIGDDVVVETDRGPSIGKVRQLKFLPIDAQKAAEMKTILRRARRKDIEANSLTPEKALEISRSRVYDLKLDMMVLQADVQFGGNKVILYFTAPGRIDFRDLVKDLASSLRSRVELKQVGARDETKILGGIGVCGREYCCSSFLREFVPVSIKMAKNQNLALNPSKVSGGCGRLLCCLTYENDMYTELRRKMPPRGARLRAVEEDFVGNVVKADLLNQTVVLESESGQQFTVAIADTEVLDSRGGPPPVEGAVESEAESWAEDIDLSQLVDDEKR
jgi:cell fate regulator YaaT (PSP1 superfamily)